MNHSHHIAENVYAHNPHPFQLPFILLRVVLAAVGVYHPSTKLQQLL
jgi:hypothetical protein